MKFIYGIVGFILFAVFIIWLRNFTNKLEYEWIERRQDRERERKLRELPEILAKEYSEFEKWRAENPTIPITNGFYSQ